MLEYWISLILGLCILGCGLVMVADGKKVGWLLVLLGGALAAYGLWGKIAVGYAVEFFGYLGKIIASIICWGLGFWLCVAGSKRTGFIAGPMYLLAAILFIAGFVLWLGPEGLKILDENLIKPLEEVGP